MSTWGKLAGASAGYLIGGIIGAVVGAVAGHYVIDNDDEDVAFAIALIALSAKMSTADGKMSEKELLAFKDILSEVPDNELKNVFKIIISLEKILLVMKLMPNRSLLYLKITRKYWRMFWMDYFI